MIKLRSRSMFLPQSAILLQLLYIKENCDIPFCAHRTFCIPKARLRLGIGLRTVSISVRREVSLTREGFPSRASMYRPATPISQVAVSIARKCWAEAFFQYISEYTVFREKEKNLGWGVTRRPAK